MANPLFHVTVTAAEANSSREALRVYIGTYNGPKSRGIYTAFFDPATGTLSPPELAAEAASPSFLALHPNRHFLYAAGEGGSISAYAIDAATGKLALLNRQPCPGGPCHLDVDKAGKCVLAANYGNGSVVAFPLEADGRLGQASTTIQHQGSSVNPDRQSGPHAHCIVVAPDDRFALACDLGLDKVLVYRLAGATLTPHEPPSASVPPGAGARHLAFHPNGRFAYVINEMGSSLTVFGYNPELGTLRALQTVSALPQGFKGTSYGAEVQVHPSGKYVYASNRGHDSIAAFGIDENSGRVNLLQCQSTEGKWPRHFALDPSGRWLLAENQNSDSIVVLRVDGATGRLSPTGHHLEVGAPVCLVFVAPAPP